MSDMKCPFCQQELRKIHPTYVICDNCRITGDKELWQELIKLMENKDLSDKIGKLKTELERTRKALDVAKDALKDNLSQANFREMLDASRFHCIRTKCESAIEQITALEQKDVKDVSGK